MISGLRFVRHTGCIAARPYRSARGSTDEGLVEASILSGRVNSGTGGLGAACCSVKIFIEQVKYLAILCSHPRPKRWTLAPVRGHGV